MTGVVTMPPSAPSVVIVIVEPVSSSRLAVPSRAASASRAHLGRAVPQVARLGVAHHRHHQAGGGLRGDADMHAAVLVQHARLVVIARVELRLPATALTIARIRNGSSVSFGRSSACGCALSARAQLFERGDVDFLDIGEVRDAALGLRHLLGDLAAQADDLDSSSPCALGERRRAPAAAPGAGADDRRRGPRA